MPLWLWQEVQALPWSTEIVALTCGTQNCLRPPSSLLKRPRQACCATPAQDQKCWNAAAFEQSQFFDHTGSSSAGWSVDLQPINARRTGGSARRSSHEAEPKSPHGIASRSAKPLLSNHIDRWVL